MPDAILNLLPASTLSRMPMPAMLEELRNLYAEAPGSWVMRLLRHIEDLEAQLAAVGAGGVEPLRRRGCLHHIEEAAPRTASQPPTNAESYRTDREIVEQTAKLAEHLLLWKHNLEPESGATRIWESQHPMAQQCWLTACEIQEMLTKTDVENALSEVEGV